MRILSMLVPLVLMSAAASADLVRSGESASRVEVRDVGLNGGRLAGVLVNRTDDEVSDVRLLASDRFLWRNEMHPGPDDPSRGMAFTVAGPIPPGGTVPFSQPMPPRPRRDDGRFMLDVTVVGLKQQPRDPWQGQGDVEPGEDDLPHERPAR